MAQPATTIYQWRYQNKDASEPLIIPVLVLCNTPDEVLLANIRHNSARADVEWVGFEKPHDEVAVLCGGGPSIASHRDDIESLRDRGGTVFAMNATSKYLRDRGIYPHYQVIADAKPETKTLIDWCVPGHLFASQVDPSCFDEIPDARLWHFEIPGMEDAFPPERRARGGYSMITGCSAVGDAALCLAYVMGYRTFHIFGYDSSHRGEASHAYRQDMNRFMPTIDVQWGDQTYRCSLAMKAQAERFQITARALIAEGCKLHVYGDGLLPAMWRTPADKLSERNKYQLVWQFDCYREYAPGESAVADFVKAAKPSGLVIDFGCGTGRGGLELKRQGLDVLLIDFADNCRDQEAMELPFLEWDLTQKIPAKAEYGFCTDVMEHIPTKDVETVIRNIMASAASVFFQISTVKDSFGALIGTPLHLTIKHHEDWRELFLAMGYAVPFHQAGDNSSQFLVTRIPSDGENKDV